MLVVVGLNYSMSNDECFQLGILYYEFVTHMIKENDRITVLQDLILKIQYYPLNVGVSHVPNKPQNRHRVETKFATCKQTSK